MMYKIKSEKAKKPYILGLLLIVFLVVTVIPACQEEDSPTGNTNPGANEVFMQNDRFTPQTLTVAAGTIVKWINKDNDTHNVIGTGFTSSDMGQNSEFTHTFGTAGTFNYRCTHHSGMNGTIVVQ